MRTKEKFPISHVLIDSENVGLTNLPELIMQTDGNPIKFILFINASSKLKISPKEFQNLTNAYTEDRLEIIELSLPKNITKKQAKNALDFYIAFYMGGVMPNYPGSHCVILSKDHDYDPLILHVQNKFDSSRCERLESYEELASRLGVTLKNNSSKKILSTKKETKNTIKTETKTKESKQVTFDLNKFVAKATKSLKKIKSPPTTINKLKHSLKNWFDSEKITDSEIEQIIKDLEKKGIIKISENKKISLTRS